MTGIRYQNVFFDLDGTICDSYAGIENSIQYAVEKAGIETLPMHEIKSMIGIPLSESLKKYFHGDVTKITQTIEYFREYYSVSGIYESKLYCGINEILSKAFQMYKLYVITAKPTLVAVQMLKFHRVDKLFTEIKGYGLEGGAFKKANLMLSVEKIGNSIIIGDKRQDIEAGKELGINTCGVLYGYGTHREIEEAKPDFIAESVVKLKCVLNL